MPTNTASPSENRLRLLGIKTIYGDGDPTTAIGSDMGIPTLYINNGTKAAFLLTETDPVTWVDVGAVSFGKNVLSILDASAAPPGAPTLGDAYLLDSTTTINAAWVTAGATYDNRVEWSGSSWLVSVQTQGDIVYVDDVSTFYIYDGSDWILLINSIGGLSYTTDSRPPNTSDNTQPVPSLWLDTAANTSYILTDVTATIATWLKMADNQLGDAQNSVLSIADSTATPPTEVLGDRYILSTDGAPNAAWDGAAQEDIVQFDGATWVALTPTEGTFCEVEDVDTVYMFVTSWVKMFTYTGATFASDSGNATPDGAGIITFAGDTAQGLDSSATGSTVTYTIADASNTQKGVLETATSAEAIAGSSGTVALTPLSFGAKLGTQTQFGVPSGNATTGALQWTTGLTDGQLVIGRSGTFPQAGTITSDFLTVTPGAGTLAVDLPQDAITTSVNSWNGSVVETPDIGVTSDGATITLSIEQSGGGDLTVVFSDGFYAWDTSPADTVTLTAGSDTSPQINYVYFLQSTKTLTASTSGWPVTEHAPVATVLCQSAASLQTDLAYKVHAWTDHIVGTDDMGHISDINYWIRQQNATWTDGVAQTYTITTNGGSADNVILTTSSGNVLQLHTQTFPAFSGTPDYYVVNDSSTPYNKVTDLNTLLTDSAGGSMSGKYFTLIIWGCVSEDTGDCKLFVNLPGGSYNGTSTLADDSNGYANYSIPDAFRGTGFLISEWQLRHQTASSGTWTSIDEIDLRGLVPNISPTTGGSGGSSTTEFVDNAFRILDEGDNTKEIAFQASGITTATTRTVTMPDKDVNLATATTTNEGIVSELATDAEAIAKTDTSRVITPSNLAALTPSETVSGLAEIATQAEVTTGTDDVRYMTPLKHVTSLASPPAIGGTAPSSGSFTQITNSEIRYQPGYTENIGIFLSGGVITLKGADGTSWSSTNPGYVCGQSLASPGELILHTLTSDVTLTDSDLDSNLLGFPTGVALDFDVELSIKLVANDSDASPLFFVTRDHQATVSPLAANIGASDDKVADAINDFFCFTTLTESSYASNPATHIGKIRGKMNASDQWDFQTLSGEKDGVGIKFPKNMDWELISIATASASSSLDFDLPEDYDEYMFRIEALQPSVDGAQFLAKYYEGGSGGTAVSDYGRSGYISDSTSLRTVYSGFQSAMVIGDSVGNVLSEALSGDILAYGCNTVSVRAKTMINTFNNTTGFKTTESRNYNYIGGARDSYDYITFYVSSGTITTGKIALFGRRYYTA